MYNFDELSKTLIELGFKDVRECKYKKGEIIDVEYLDTREKSLFVEGKK